ncbi:ferritin-like domain-containing protein [Fusibacter tunisiensis]|uniref:DUF2202 domain-containing protein n=1 Tax=Fusibacter tunisiensis TaxID=1008308 RepID=A0ABS2MT62_9FIRM|nr:DUF2202 domain-containing protein [Fusibacter tunisiensis]MBM7562594.1 hypothetical protein [Fusibacter tunisiensis]
MKSKKMIIGLMMLVTLLANGVVMADVNDYGAVGAMTDEAYTLEEMLVYAIQDEYLARGEYESIMEKFDVQRPFSNIIKSEETHISLLVPLFEQYGFEIPTDTSEDHLIIPDTITETYAIGVEAEENNIEMYATFLQQDLPEEVRDVFERLLASSENHLSAFENGLSRSTQGFGRRGK